MRPTKTSCIDCNVAFQIKPRGKIPKRCYECERKERQKRLMDFLKNATEENERVGVSDE